MMSLNVQKDCKLYGKVKELLPLFETQSISSRNLNRSSGSLRRRPIEVPKRILAAASQSSSAKPKSNLLSPSKISSNQSQSSAFGDENDLENEYKLGKNIANGRFGKVYECKQVSTNCKMAAKIIQCITQEARENARQEVRILSIIDHPRLLHFEAAFERRKDLIIITEFVDGEELFDRLIAANEPLLEHECANYIRQICDALSYLQRKQIVHLDLKPENLLVERDGFKLKIIDFGLARHLEAGQVIKTMAGTAEFVPPEVINFEPITLRADMWSVGVLIYVLVSGLSPFLGDDENETLVNVTRGQFDYDDPVFESVSNEVKDLIDRLLVKRPSNRMSADDCLKHKWLVQDEKMIMKSKRNSIPVDRLRKFCNRRKFKNTANAFVAMERINRSMSQSSST